MAVYVLNKLSLVEIDQRDSDTICRNKSGKEELLHIRHCIAYYFALL